MSRYRPSQTLLDQAINAKWHRGEKLRSPNEHVYMYLDYGHDTNKVLASEMIKMASRHAKYTKNIRLRDAARFANISNMIMISASCMQWERVKVAHSLKRVHKIGNYNYIYLKHEEITETECIKHIKYLEDLYL